MNQASSGKLFVVAVPIGHLEDITVRAQRVLGEVACIACEDTRQTGKLLERLGVARRSLLSLHEHNEAARVEAVLARLATGDDVALVSDAGTPTISDPGYRLVKAAAGVGVQIVPVPGVCAAIAALSASGLPTDQFRFVGFPPAKAGARRAWLDGLSGAEETLILYVSPHRARDVIADAAAAFGDDRPAVLARELTKLYESFRRGTLGELVADPGTIRGEMVLLVDRAPPEAAAGPDAVADAVRELLDTGWTPSRAAKEAARRTGASREAAYRCVVAIRDEEP